MYRTMVPAEAMAQNSELTFAGSVNDVATVRHHLLMLTRFQVLGFSAGCSFSNPFSVTALAGVLMCHCPAYPPCQFAKHAHAHMDPSHVFMCPCAGIDGRLGGRRAGP